MWIFGVQLSCITMSMITLFYRCKTWCLRCSFSSPEWIVSWSISRNLSGPNRNWREPCNFKFLYMYSPIMVLNFLVCTSSSASYTACVMITVLWQWGNVCRCMHSAWIRWTAIVQYLLTTELLPCALMGSCPVVIIVVHACTASCGSDPPRLLPKEGEKKIWWKLWHCLSLVVLAPVFGHACSITR